MNLDSRAAARTAVGILTFFFAGAVASPGSDLDLAFLIDTTGSMGQEIAEAKQRVREIAARAAEGRRGGRVRIGVVAFRDRRDQYQTLISPLQSDVEESFAFLARLQADGGGDGPEDVLAGLERALHALPWSPGEDAEKHIVLVGDAPPHLDYADGPRAEDLIRDARERRIVIDAIGCRSLPPEGVAFFRRLAYETEGFYRHIGRVRSSEAGLGEAVVEAVVPPKLASRAEGGIAVRTRPSSSGDATGTQGLLVRLLERSAAQGAGGAHERCSLEVLLPESIHLENDPRLTLRTNELEVALSVAQGGPGGRLVYEIEPCVASNSRIRVSFGG